MNAAEPRDCPRCGTPGRGRLCGRCGAQQQPAALANDAPIHDASAEPPASAHEPTPDRTISRRTVLAAIGGVLGGSILTYLMGHPSAPLDDDGLPTADLRIGAVSDVLARIRRDGPLLIPEETARVAVVMWDPSYRSDAGSARSRYGPGAEDHPIIDGTTGLMVLSLLSLLSPTDPVCRVRFCASSQWFEEPCYGSRFNRWGEWTGGPAGRGLDRYRSRVTDDGHLVASLSDYIVGPFRENGVFEDSPQGPVCIYD